MTDAEILTCPKCEASLNPVTVGGISVHRCEGCAGVWLDEGERMKLLKDKATVKAVDTGSADVGEKQDAITTGPCPRCQKPLNHVADRAQKHVGFEYCRTCQGSFFDAGELTDLSEFTLSERIRALLSR